MKTEELRIGNYILGQYYDTDDETELYELCRVLALDSVGAFEYSISVHGLDRTGIEYYDTFEPIPLTEEWLLKFGFEHENDMWFKFTPDNHFVTLSYGNTAWGLWDDDYGCVRHGINKYVHQIQNLYYALTGEELTIKQ